MSDVLLELLPVILGAAMVLLHPIIVRLLQSEKGSATFQVATPASCWRCIHLLVTTPK